MVGSAPTEDQHFGTRQLTVDPVFERQKYMFLPERFQVWIGFYKFWKAEGAKISVRRFLRGSVETNKKVPYVMRVADVYV
jgi:hypothetical protein